MKSWFEDMRRVANILNFALEIVILVVTLVSISYRVNPKYLYGHKCLSSTTHISIEIEHSVKYYNIIGTYLLYSFFKDKLNLRNKIHNA